MPLVPFRQLMADARHGQYAVGYFESWNLESLLAVADAAEQRRSPVILGFSGIYLPAPDRVAHDRLETYAAMAREVCANLSVPAALLFNESPHWDWVVSALELGFNLVMFSDEELPPLDRARKISQLVERAHACGAAVEAELDALAGVAGDLNDDESGIDRRWTDPDAARKFVEQTAIDALAVNVGQMHLHGRRAVRLDLDRLQSLSQLPVPLVLHGATSVAKEDLQSAIRLGVCKINIGSSLKQVYFDALRKACAAVGDDFNPYEVVGSGLAADVQMTARMALQRHVEDWIELFGSSQRAPMSGAIH